MPPQTTEIEAKFLREFWRSQSGDFYIGEVLPVSLLGNGDDANVSEDPAGEICTGGKFIRLPKSFGSPPGAVKVKGQTPPESSPHPGLTYRFYGQYETHPKYGESFAVRTFTQSVPAERHGIVKYLQQVKGIGQGIAEAAWENFGSDAVKVMRESPDQAAKVLGRRYAKMADSVAEKLGEMSGLEGVTLDLLNLLDGRRFPKKLLHKVMQRWGNQAAEKIKRNPYCLLAYSGAGFKKCDAMYLGLGLNPARLKRQGLCAWHAVSSDSTGSTWISTREIERHLRENIGGALVQPVRAAQFARRAGLLSFRKTGTPESGYQYWVADSAKARDEGYIAKRVAAMLKSDANPWPNVGRLKRASDHQKAALEKAFNLGGDIAILRGYPGTGKSFVAGELAKVFIEEYGQDNIAFVAPTGRAAVRLTEAMQDNGVPIRATTTHSLLGVQSAPDEDEKEGGWVFAFNQWEPLPHKVVMVDETSMKGCGMMASLLSAMPQGSKLVLVGDTGQLPPVEYGAPLRDFIAAGVPTATLSEIRRNSGTIVHACHAIANDASIIPIDQPEQINPNATPPKNLGLVNAADSEAAADRIVERICMIRDRGLCDPIWDVQVLVATNKKSPLSRVALNKRLQDVLNPHGEQCGDMPFRIGDKVIQLKNKMLKREGRQTGESEDVYAANGDMGRVIGWSGRTVVADFLGGEKRIVRVPVGKNGGDDRNGSESGGGDDAGESGEGGENGNDGNESGCKMDLGFACTVWKFQGSEVPVAMMALDEKAYNTSKQFAFTAISRAKKLCLMFGKRSTLDKMRRKDAIASRKTFLVESIRKNLQ